VERVLAARSSRERAAQLAAVIRAVSALAEAHGLSQSELEALRAGVSPHSVAGFKRELRQRARGAVAQVWSAGGSVALRGQKALGLSPRSLATALLKRQLKRVSPSTRAGWMPGLPRLLLGAPRDLLLGAPRDLLRGAPRDLLRGVSTRARSPFVLRVGRPGGHTRGTQLIAASLLHLPRLQRQVMALRRSADVALHTVKLVRLPASPIGSEHVAAAGLLLRSSRSGLQLTYEVASAGAQLFLRSYVFPRVLRYLSAGLSTGVALREVANARVLPPR
jgi:hypothetical protein